jgi:hypothetical protein
VHLLPFKQGIRMHAHKGSAAFKAPGFCHKRNDAPAELGSVGARPTQMLTAHEGAVFVSRRVF